MAANGASHDALVRITSVRTSRCWLWAMSMGVTETERPLALPAQALGGEAVARWRGLGPALASA